MKERPILFSAPMVRALLDDSKTRTRRVVKPQPSFFGSMTNPNAPFKTLDAGLHCEISCPYGQPGDRLWVRESFRFPDVLDALSPISVGVKSVDAGYRTPWCPTQFEADGWRTNEHDWKHFVTPPYTAEPGKLRPGIHMPRWASRITLEITAVRVERLQDISDGDARAEGARNLDVASCRETLDPYSRQGSCVAHYKHIWQQINGADSWDANPWVWVIEFKRIES
jgi:hypothetical protein